MSPGKAAYEQRKQEKIERKLKMEKTAAEFAARQAKSEELIDLFMEAASAFLRGDAELIIEDVDAKGTRRVVFQHNPR